MPQRIASRLTSRAKPRTPLQNSPDIQSIDEANNTLQRPGKVIVICESYFFNNLSLDKNDIKQNIYNWDHTEV